MLFSNVLKSLFGRREEPASAGVSPSSSPTADRSLRDVILPRRPSTRMESEICGDLRAHFDVSNPSREDLKNAGTLLQGSLHAIWTELHGRDGAGVDATFVGHGAHREAPYVLLRAKHASLYLFEAVKAHLQRLEGATVERENTVSKDDVSIVIQFPREGGFSEPFSDRRQLRRVLELVALPPADVDTVAVTRLILHSVPVKSVVGIDRLGDHPYEVSLSCSTPRISVRREPLPAAA